MFNSQTDFSVFIETEAIKNQNLLMTQIIEYCTENYIEFEDIAKLVSPSLKEKIKIEAEKEFLLPRETTRVLEFNEDEPSM